MQFILLHFLCFYDAKVRLFVKYSKLFPKYFKLFEKYLAFCKLKFPFAMVLHISIANIYSN